MFGRTGFCVCSCVARSSDGVVGSVDYFRVDGFGVEVLAVLIAWVAGEREREGERESDNSHWWCSVLVSRRMTTPLTSSAVRHKGTHAFPHRPLHTTVHTGVCRSVHPHHHRQHPHPATTQHSVRLLESTLFTRTGAKTYNSWEGSQPSLAGE